MNTLIYVIIGILFSIWYWYTYCNATYQKLMEEHKVDKNMDVITMLVLVFLWPLFLINEIYNMFLNKDD